MAFNFKIAAQAHNLNRNHLEITILFLIIFLEYALLLWFALKIVCKLVILQVIILVTVMYSLWAIKSLEWYIVTRDKY